MVSVLGLASPRQGDRSRRYRCKLAVLHRLESGALQRIAQADKITFQDVQLAFVVWSRNAIISFALSVQ
jgi:hypothetical protein